MLRKTNLANYSIYPKGYSGGNQWYWTATASQKGMLLVDREWAVTHLRFALPML
ncbi:hypothetical protein [Sphingobacterium allocomposti]|uniref:hypothetical protein n=1 Tax=Sphingobacterium allocomposti TaxID=415956 RepID=UPI001479264F|nr:hypothetical protein [Sphingobacterium composti Yoo et al. 2007 non Ten et al. 2007]